MPGALSNGHTASVNCLCLLEPGPAQLLASGADDGAVCLWDPRLMQLVGKLDSPASGPATSVDPVTSLAFAPSCGSLLAAQGRRLVSWDLRAGLGPQRQPVLDLRAAQDEINCLTVLDSERRVATADDTGSVKVFDCVSGELVKAMRKHENIASSVLFRPGAPWQLVSGGMDSRLILANWKAARAHAVDIFEMPELQPAADASEAPGLGLLNPPLVLCLAGETAAAAAADEAQAEVAGGCRVAAGLASGCVELFSGRGRHHLGHVGGLRGGHAAGVSALLWLPGGRLLSGGNDRRCLLWSAADAAAAPGARPLASFPHRDKVAAMCGRGLDRVFIADTGCTVHCRDLTVA